ncbi:unnamed protein product, partial [Mesorhabditis belari]|uniref:Glycerophosphocholine acyltransferase 1 n=1 Tax=Mesorhabditis belari TaxID=2138241 RepID=A0AAF3ELM4_9BILA
MLQTPFGLEDSDSENERFNRCSVHIQTWTYIHNGISTFVCLIAFIFGVMALLWPEWHEWLTLYKQYLAYARRADPILYWLCYKIFFISWIFIHVTHFMTIIVTIIGIQTIRPSLVFPQLIHLMVHLGLLTVLLAAVLIICSTAAKIAWFTLGLILIFMFPVCSNLYILVVFYEFIYEKYDALQAVLANTKQVHFKER